MVSVCVAEFEKREVRRQVNTKERVGQVLLDLQGTVDRPGPIGDLGLMVEDVTVTPAGKRRLVRIWLDRDLADLGADDESSVVEPLSLDEVADATRIIGAALDDSDALGEAPYVLEVGSSGVDRPLTAWRHFRRNVTRLVEISTTNDAAGVARTTGDPSSRVTGRLLAADPTGVTVLLAATKDAPETRLHIAYADIARAEVQVEFAHVTAEHVTEEEES